MNLRLSRAVTVRLAQGEPVIPDVTAATLPERFRGKPKIDSSACPEGCSKCVDACPTGAISLNPLTIDLGACVFCPLCTEACPEALLLTPTITKWRPPHAKDCCCAKAATFRRKVVRRK